MEDKLAKAKGSRRAASSLARTLRALAAAPTHTTLATKPHEAQPAPAPVGPSKKIVPQVLPELSRPAAPSQEKLEPEMLAIGPGYVGVIP